MNSMALLAATLSSLVGAQSPVRNHADVGDSLFADCPSQIERLRNITCEMDDENPSEFGCSYRITSADAHRYTQFGQFTVGQGPEGEIDLGGASLCTGVPPNPDDILRIETLDWAILQRRYDLGENSLPIAVRDVRCDDLGYNVFSCFYVIDHGSEPEVEGTIRRRNVAIGRSEPHNWSKVIIVTTH